QAALDRRPEAVPAQGGQGARQAQRPPVRRESEREATPRGERAAAFPRPRSRPQADEAREADQAGASEQRPSPDPAAPQAQETPQARASASAPARKGQRQGRRHRRDPRQLQVAARTPAWVSSIAATPS